MENSLWRWLKLAGSLSPKVKPWSFRFSDPTNPTTACVLCHTSGDTTLQWSHITLDYWTDSLSLLAKTKTVSCIASLIRRSYSGQIFCLCSFFVWHLIFSLDHFTPFHSVWVAKLCLANARTPNWLEQHWTQSQSQAGTQMKMQIWKHISH